MATKATADAPSRAYHHGDLPAALVQAALDVVREDGTSAVTLSEVARRVAVSGSAPYRHFPDREALLAAVGEQGFGLLERALRDARRRARSDARRLVAMTDAYLTFALDHRDHMLVLFSAGLDKPQHPDLVAAGERAMEVVAGTATSYCGSAQRGQALALSLWALAHGYAMLAVDGSLTHHDVDSAAARVSLTRAARRLVDSWAPIG